MCVFAFAFHGGEMEGLYASLGLKFLIWFKSQRVNACLMARLSKLFEPLNSRLY